MLVVDELQTVSVKAKLFRGFADASRLAILETLRSGSHTVNDIVLETGLGQSNVSNHLGCLRECGLVRRERRGRFADYQLASPEIAAVLLAGDRLLEQVSELIANCANYDCGERKAASRRAP